MDECTNILNELENNVFQFPFGAQSVDNLKSYDEKIQKIKTNITQLEAKKLQFLTLRDKEILPLPEADIETLMFDVKNEAVKSLINKKALEICMLRKSVLDIYLQSRGFQETSKVQINGHLDLLCSYKENFILIIDQKKKLFEENIYLQTLCRTAIFDYQKFVHERARQQKEKLEKQHPDIVKLELIKKSKILKINIIKVLLAGFISADRTNLRKYEFYRKYLEKHDSPITEDDIS